MTGEQNRSLGENHRLQRKSSQFSGTAKISPILYDDWYETDKHKWGASPVETLQKIQADVENIIAWLSGDQKVRFQELMSITGRNNKNVTNRGRVCRFKSVSGNRA
jgi:hypothetical protein